MATLLIVAANLIGVARPFSGRATTPSRPGPGPEAYVVVEARLKPSEAGRFMDSYASRVPALVAKYGGEYVVLGGRHEPLEGEWGETRLVLHRWPNAEMARRFWHSEEYREVKKGREGTGEFRVMLVEGLERGDLEEPN